MKIERDTIVQTALDLLDEVGLDKFTTRALAARLGVQQPALYWHFKSRRALLDAMNDALLAVYFSDDDAAPGQDWQDYVFGVGCKFRQALMSRRDGARIHAGTPANRGQYERQLQLMTQSGLPLATATYLSVAVARFVVGWVLEEQADPPDPALMAEKLAGAFASTTLAARAIQTYWSGGETLAFETGLRYLIQGAAQQM